MGVACLFVLALSAAVCAPAMRAVVAEVVYDATGDDTGWEFVELFNPHAAAVALAGVRLEAGDGSAPGRWTLRWTGGVADAVPALGRFVVGGANVAPPPDAVATLELQNGPDAVRIVWPDGATEVVGWGPHEFPEYACGAPAADVPSGRSLARIPDDADFGGNALDFRAADPSPGVANQLSRDAAIGAGSLALAPESPRPGEPSRLALLIENRGRDPIGAGELLVRADGATFAAAAEAALAEPLPPGESVSITLDLVAGAAGRHVAFARLMFAGDERPANDADSIAVRVGPGPLEITEIQFHPASGEGEWIEVRNRSGAPLALSAFRLADRAGTPGAPQTAATLAPESLAVLAQDREALLARTSGLDTARVVESRPWAALNNSDDSTGVADVVTLREADGLLVQRVPYGATGVPAGMPLEWFGGSWRPALSAAGTPLRPPLERAAIAGAFLLAPARMRAGDAMLRAAWRLPWNRARVTIELYDMAGRRVAVVARDVETGARDERQFAVRALRPGVYVAALRAEAWSGGGALTASQAIRVDGPLP